MALYWCLKRAMYHSGFWRNSEFEYELELEMSIEWFWIWKPIGFLQICSWSIVMVGKGVSLIKLLHMRFSSHSFCVECGIRVFKNRKICRFLDVEMCNMQYMGKNLHWVVFSCITMHKIETLFSFLHFLLPKWCFGSTGDISGCIQGSPKDTEVWAMLLLA